MSKNYTRNLIFSALLIALEIVFAKLLSFSTPFYKINLSFLPIAIASMLMGPFWGMGIAFASDLIGTLLAGESYCFLFTINAVLYALIYSLFLYKKEKTPLRIILCVIVQTALVSIPLTPLWLYIFFKYIMGTPHGFNIIFVSKFIASLIDAPLKIIVLLPTCRYLCPQLSKILHRR